MNNKRTARENATCMVTDNLVPNRKGYQGSKSIPWGQDFEGNKYPTRYKSAQMQPGRKINSKRTKSAHFIGAKGRRRENTFQLRTGNAWLSQNSSDEVSDWKGNSGETNVVNDEVFCPASWKRFHITDQLIDISSKVPLRQSKEVTGNEKLDGSQAWTRRNMRHRAKILARGYHPQSRFETDEGDTQEKYIWQRHVNMIKISRPTSYYNFLSEYDRHSCRACSHSKTCSSKHCSTCDPCTKCEKHSINIDFLRYASFESSNELDNKKTTRPKSIRTAAGKPNNISENIIGQASASTNSSLKRFTGKEDFILRQIPPKTEQKMFTNKETEGKGEAKARSHRCMACEFAKQEAGVKDSGESWDKKLCAPSTKRWPLKCRPATAH